MCGKQFDFSYEDEESSEQVLDRRRLRELIWNEIGDFRPSCMAGLKSSILTAAADRATMTPVMMTMEDDSVDL